MPNLCIFFPPPFLHFSTLFQTPPRILSFSLCIFKLNYVCLLGGSDIPLHAATSGPGNAAQPRRVYSDLLISFSSLDCKTFLVHKRLHRTTRSWERLRGCARTAGAEAEQNSDDFYFFSCRFAVFLIYLFLIASGYCLGVIFLHEVPVSLVQIALLGMAVTAIRTLQCRPAIVCSSNYHQMRVLPTNVSF